MDPTKDPTFIEFSVPELPPDLNHYVRHTRDGRHYKTAASKDFKKLFSYFVPGHVVGKKFQVTATFHLPPGKKGDVDGFAKLLLDCLAACKVFQQRTKRGLQPVSDAHVYSLHLHKLRAAAPRTEISVAALVEDNLEG